ncbi:MAG: hypothetical protein U0P81_09750 [Holophagaceae bacterium]
MRTFAALAWLAALAAAAVLVPDRLALPVGAAAAAAGFGALAGLRAWYQRLAIREEALAGGAGPAALPPAGLPERALGLDDAQSAGRQLDLLRAWMPRVLAAGVAAGLLGLGGVLGLVVHCSE